LICVMVHCWGRGLEIILGDRSHIHVYEQGTIAQFGGVHHRSVKNFDDGTFSVEEMKGLFRSGAPEDPHDPITSLVCIENTQNKCGGRALPLAWIEEVALACKELKLPLHCDGARLFNSAVSLNLPTSELVKHCDTVSVCLSKGLGAPVGSVIVGSEKFITKAIRVRKALGGGMRQVGILAAAGLYGLTHNKNRMSIDHQNAKKVAKAIKDYGVGVATIDEASVDTNLVFAKLHPEYVALDFVARMAKTSEDPDDQVAVQICQMGKNTIRICLHLDNSDDKMVDQICKKLRFVFNITWARVNQN